MCNADFEGLLLGADSKLTSFDVSGDNNGLRNGTIGSSSGSVCCRRTTCQQLHPGFVAFHPEAAAYVSQLDKVEACAPTTASPTGCAACTCTAARLSVRTASSSSE
ncbi:hypothetical protein [Gordonia westfalica]|uniref:Uncharacterized protein n=1 Tax=Gordonia westfalica TaxID=158898 RepID=A0A1H2EIL3_9ACTN|nr:hypothetical protein [Gordonia westfalica]SDT83758.1 hypothetical protein SAMN04488548_1032 [Gordonia westfalica]SDT94976.1 hypothetical protein SAMN04488548_13222 [Gordonia westfalica]